MINHQDHADQNGAHGDQHVDVHTCGHLRALSHLHQILEVEDAEQDDEDQGDDLGEAVEDLHELLRIFGFLIHDGVHQVDADVAIVDERAARADVGHGNEQVTCQLLTPGRTDFQNIAADDLENDRESQHPHERSQKTVFYFDDPMFDFAAGNDRIPFFFHIQTSIYQFIANCFP